MRFVQVVLSALVVAITGSAVRGQCGQQQLAGIMPGNAGTSLDMTDDLLLVGSLDAGDGAGGWSLHQRHDGEWELVGGAVASSPSELGATVALSESGHFAVSAASALNLSGGVGRVETYFWNGTEVVSTGTLEPDVTAGIAVNSFGHSVAIREDGKWLIIGAPAAYYDRGYVYTYERVGTEWIHRGLALVSIKPDQYGAAVGISGATVVVGIPKYADGRGGVAFYELDEATGWFVDKGFTFGLSEGGQYGTSIAIDGDHVVVSGPFDKLGGRRAGGVLFFEKGVLVGTALGTGAEQLGGSLAVGDGRVLVGRVNGKGALVNRYEFLEDGLGIDVLAPFSSATALAGECFGRAVAIHGDQCAVGAPYYDADGSTLTGLEGRVLTYAAAFEKERTRNLGHGLAGDYLRVPALSVQGDVCAGTPSTIQLTNASAEALSMVFIGWERIDAAFKGGTLVPAPHVAVPFLTDAAGALSMRLDWPGGVDAVPITVQCWIEDVSGPQGVSASNAVLVLPGF